MKSEPGMLVARNNLTEGTCTTTAHASHIKIREGKRLRGQCSRNRPGKSRVDQKLAQKKKKKEKGGCLQSIANELYQKFIEPS